MLIASITARRFHACVLAGVFLAAGLASISASSVSGQEPGRADLDPVGCANGTFVTSPQDYPDLVTDCWALVAIRNFWSNHPANADTDYSPIWNWGSGNAGLSEVWSSKDVRGWHGVEVRDGKLVSLGLDCDSVEICDSEVIQIGGPIPAEIGDFTNLRELNLSENRFFGALPESIGELSTLEVLVVSGVAPGGQLPSSIGKLSHLRKLWLSGPMFIGNLPVEIVNLLELTDLQITDTGIGGSLPSDFGKLTKMYNLDLSRNDISGTIPSSIGDLANLDFLAFQGNQLSGSIPGEIGNLIHIEQLFFSHNELSGPIPAGLGNLKDAYFINLSYNNLSGDIPAELGGLPELEVLYLNNNGLSGSLPEELGELSSLDWLFVQNNQLEGPIPNAMGKLSLSLFDFCGNNIEPPVPVGLRNIEAVTSRSLPVIDPDNGNFFCPERWRVASASSEVAANSELLDSLNTDIWAWDADNQTWRSLEPTNETLPEGTAIAYRSATFSEYRILNLGLNLTNFDITLRLYPGWNILAAPIKFDRPPGYEDSLFIHHSLIDCGDTASGVIAVVHYNNRSGRSIETPCHQKRQLNQNAGGYTPLNQIKRGDFIFIYFRSLLPVSIQWQPASQFYEAVSS